VIIDVVQQGDLFREEDGNIWEVQWVIEQPTVVLRRITEIRPTTTADTEYVKLGSNCVWLKQGPWR
jgi:hypothetical protein